MFLKRAMRYYRVWIYCCNIALLIATVVFVLFFLWFLTDVHMSLFPSISIYHPSFLYAFVALVLQAGVLQAIGCYGAIRMSEKLLNLYWNLMVILLMGDAVVGVIWLFRYNVLVATLKSDLKAKLNADYGSDPAFREVWDRIQVESQCCGIDNPFDYNSTAWRREHQSAVMPPSSTSGLSIDFAYCVVPLSCRRSHPPSPSRPHTPAATASLVAVVSMTNDDKSAADDHWSPAHRPHHNRPDSHHLHVARHSHFSSSPRQHQQHDQQSRQWTHRHRHRRRRSHREHAVNRSTADLPASSSPSAGRLVDANGSSGKAMAACETSFDPKVIHVFGCYDSIAAWLTRATDVLSVLGFCVITFLKVCFACILRYEIREMIQKIQVLKRSSSSIPCPPSGHQQPPPSSSSEAAAVVTTVTAMPVSSSSREAVAPTPAKNEDKI